MLLPSITSSLQNKLKNVNRLNDYSQSFMRAREVWGSVPKGLKGRLKFILFFLVMLLSIAFIVITTE